jgi:hypothetical protein
MTNWSWLAWGMERKLSFLTLCAMLLGAVSLSQEIAGGPTVQPERMVRGENSSLMEVAPTILDLELKKGDPFWELFIVAVGDLGCYDKREYEISRETSETLVIPRLQRSRPESTCKPRKDSFRDKVADLDPNSTSSQKIRVLSYNGWIEVGREP